MIIYALYISDYSLNISSPVKVLFNNNNNNNNSNNNNNNNNNNC